MWSCRKILFLQKPFEFATQTEVFTQALLTKAYIQLVHKLPVIDNKEGTPDKNLPDNGSDNDWQKKNHLYISLKCLHFNQNCLNSNRNFHS